MMAKGTKTIDKYLVLIPAILISAEGIFLIINSMIKGASLFSFIGLLLDDSSSINLYDFYILIGIDRIVSAVYGGAKNNDFGKPAELIGFGIVLILSSFLGLASFLMIEPTAKADSYFIIIEVLFSCILSICFLIGIINQRNHA